MKWRAGGDGRNEGPEEKEEMTGRRRRTRNVKSSAATEVKNIDEVGSISPLVIFYFSILMILIFLISNVASVYIARRELTNRVEAGLAIAAQELDELRYYYGSPLTDYLAEDAIKDRRLKVPIDCNDSRAVFHKTIHTSQIALETEVQFKCDGFEIGAVVSEIHQLPFQLRAFGITSFKNQVSAATSSYLLKR